MLLTYQHPHMDFSFLLFCVNARNRTREDNDNRDHIHDILTSTYINCLKYNTTTTFDTTVGIIIEKKIVMWYRGFQMVIRYDSMLFNEKKEN